MILLLLSVGLQNALSQALFKFVGELTIEGESLLSPLAFILILTGTLMSGTQFWLLNVAMKYYNQIEIAPIYESFVILGKLTTGLILLNEQALYSGLQIVGLCATSMLSVVGIAIIAKKHTILNDKATNYETNKIPLLTKAYRQE